MMTALNPLTGTLYLEALEITRRAREMTVLAWGKYPHPQTIVPGGISATVTLQTLNEYQTRLFELLDHAKGWPPSGTTSPTSCTRPNPRYKQVGRRPKNLIDLGIWDHHEALRRDVRERGDAWGERRWATPGVMIDGELVTTESAPHQHRASRSSSSTPTTSSWDDAPPPLPDRSARQSAQPVPPLEQGDAARSRPGRNWREKYTWDTSPRWDRQVVEAGAYARMWITTAANKIPPTRSSQTDGRDACGWRCRRAGCPR